MMQRHVRHETDMSPEAIEVRLRELASLWKLGMSLRGARRLGKAADLDRGESVGETDDKPEEIASDPLP